MGTKALHEHGIAEVLKGGGRVVLAETLCHKVRKILDVIVHFSLNPSPTGTSVLALIAKKNIYE